MKTFFQHLNEAGIQRKRRLESALGKDLDKFKGLPIPVSRSQEQIYVDAENAYLNSSEKTETEQASRIHRIVHRAINHTPLLTKRGKARSTSDIVADIGNHLDHMIDQFRKL